MTNLIRKVMDNLSNLTVAPYTDLQRQAIADAQATVDKVTDELDFQRDMTHLRVLAAMAVDAHVRAGHLPSEASIFDQLVDEIGSPL